MTLSPHLLRLVESGKATQFGGTRGNPAGRPPGVLVGKRRARALRQAAAVSEVVEGPLPEYDGTDSREFLIGVMRGQYRADPARMAAAHALLRVQHPALQAVAVGAAQSLEQLVVQSLTDEQLNARVTKLLTSAAVPALPLLEGTVEPADPLADVRRRAGDLLAQARADGDSERIVELERMIAEMPQPGG